MIIDTEDLWREFYKGGTVGEIRRRIVDRVMIKVLDAVDDRITELEDCSAGYIRSEIRNMEFEIK